MLPVIYRANSFPRFQIAEALQRALASIEKLSLLRLC